MQLVRLGFFILFLVQFLSVFGQTPDRHDHSCAWDSIQALALMHRDNGSYEMAIQEHARAMNIAVSHHDTDLRTRSLISEGLTHHRYKIHKNAWVVWTTAMKEAERTQDMDAVAELHNYLGVVQYHMNDHDKAAYHFNLSLEMRKQIGTAHDVGIMLNNLAAYEEKFGSVRKAIDMYRSSARHWDEIGNPGWKVLTFSHIGRCFEELDLPDSARIYYEDAFKFIRPGNSVDRRYSLFQNLGRWHARYGDPRTAIEYCSSSLARSEQTANLDDRRNCGECLSIAYERIGDHAKALKYFRLVVGVKDSIDLREQQRDIALLQAGHDYERRLLADSLRMEEQHLRSEMEHAAILNAERGRRNLLLISTLSVLLLSGGLYYRLRFTRRSRELVRHERDRADQLLRNILPAQVATELKALGRSEPQEFKIATILFTDFHDFTRITEELSARELVSAIDECFTNFDRILKEHGVEKIKTVGDCYMACGGVPDPSRGSPVEVVKAGLALQEFMARHAADRQAAGLPFFTMRLGIHTGPVVAGIVGTDKFAYDIWGDAVNIAARMENTGMVGAVNISAHTYELVKTDPDLVFVERGMIQTKGKGRLSMYFAERLVHEPGTPPEQATAVARA